jgi:hypothetical protein
LKSEARVVSVTGAPVPVNRHQAVLDIVVPGSSHPVDPLSGSAACVV